MRLATLRQARQRSRFEVLVRHFVDRLFTNEAFGEDVATRIAQLGYAIALPGLLVALFLFPAYHGIPPGPRPYWLQACDHLFYVLYAFVVMGAITVFQSEMLFPDITDVYVLSSLPLRRGEQLAGRVAALVLMLGVVLAGTNLLGWLFFPAVADLTRTWWRHLAIHGLAVVASGSFAAAAFVALQSLLLCVLPPRLLRRLSAVIQTLSLSLLLLLLFLFPVIAHFLRLLLTSRTDLLWFPPFWFLGIYERGLLGSTALPVFALLARRGWIATGVAVGLALLLYPVAYARRTRQLIESADAAEAASGTSRLWRALLHRTIVRRPEQRAIYHFVGLTLARSPRLQLYLGMYGGAGLALVISGLLLLEIGGSSVRLAVSDWGLRAAVPIAAFWAAVGLRTAIAAPVGRAGRWIFAVSSGRPKREEVRAARLWVLLRVLLLALATQGAVFALAPAFLREPRVLASQLLVAIASSVLLTGFFLRDLDSIPFTATRASTTVELPLIFTRYVFVFPALTLSIVSCESWLEAGWLHLLEATAAVAAAQWLLSRREQRRWNERQQAVDLIEDDAMLSGLGLRD